MVSIEQLSNGITVTTDSIENFETVSIGLFVNVGSVNESEQQTGISHFLEHMAFKGTATRSALQISSAIESVGGYINAYTSKEVTAFHAKVLKDDVKLAVDIITDIIQNSTFNAEEFTKEQGVIIQEIRQLNDAPDDYVFDMFQAKCFEAEKLGTQILGSEENILSYKPSDLDMYLKTKYSTDKMILSASGKISQEQLVGLANNFTTKMTKFDIETVAKQVYRGGFSFKQKDLEQTHLIFGFEGVSHTDERKYDLTILSAILGGGMSSRLFQEIREKRGLAYSVFSFCTSYRDTGTFGVYAACEDSKAEEVVKLTIAELEKIQNSITKEELNKAKMQLRASLMMGLESSSTRMERMANQYIHLGRIVEPSEVVEKIEAISVESLKELAMKIFNTKPTLAFIGKGKDAEKLHAFA
ncbi:MAG: insulinase family protein [Alphaproteobacteria bacterium]|nr:insulinase family protein [Alphaproteobacteria bacterium]